MGRTTFLPRYLIDAIENCLKDYPKRILKEDFQLIAQRIKPQLVALPLNHKQEESKVSDATKTTLYSYGQRESAAYLAAQFPHNYGFLHNILSEIKERNPQFTPKRVLDFGCGPGTAYWSCIDVWDVHSNALEYTGIDVSQEMIDLGNQLLAHAAEKNNVTFKRFLPVPTQVCASFYDLVICNFSLLEVCRDACIFDLTLRNLWAQTGSFLVVANAADWEGFQATQRVKQFIVANGGHIFAPCCNSLPATKTNCACIFEHRTELVALQRETIGLNDIPRKYSYMVGAKFPVQVHKGLGRIVGPPEKLNKYVEFNLCTGNQDDIVEGCVRKSDSKEAYARARKSKWGDLWTLPYTLKKKQVNETTSTMQ